MYSLNEIEEKIQLAKKLGLSCAELLDAPFFNHRVWHMGGICSADCAALLRDFFAPRRLPGGEASPACRKGEGNHA